MSKKRTVNKGWMINFKTYPSKWFGRSLKLWMSSLLLLGGSVYYLTATHQTVLDPDAQWVWYILVADFVVGVFAFLSMIFFKILERPKLKPIGVIVAIVLFIGVVGIVEAYLDNQIKSQNAQVNTIPEPTPAEYPSPTISPSLTTKIPEERILAKKKIEAANTDGGGFVCVGPDGKIFKTSETECKKLNESWGKPMDYMVNCKVSTTCGGGTRYIKKSECDKSVCCQIGNGWFFYPTAEKCRQDQSSGKPSSQYDYVSPTIQPWDGKISCSYSGGIYSYDFGKLTFEECLVKMDQYWNEQNDKIVTAPVVLSQPSISKEQEELLKQHDQACKDAVSEWETIKENFNSTEYNNFSSSVEAVTELTRRKNIYQNELNSVGCGAYTVDIY